MPLTFEKEINLTEYEGNPSPKVVEQLSIVHESQQGDISQYYIVPVTKQAGDKASSAIGIKHERTNNTPAYYTYDDYDELTWNTKKGSRITRQRIDRLGVKAFPNVGAIAHYKLTYRNLSRILAPVNYVTHKYKSPILSAELHETYIHFTITPPDTSNTSEEDLIEYQVYRICMQWNQFTLEYVTYDLEYDVPLPPTTGTYSCWCIGYVNEGEACSNDSNTIDLDIQGTRSDWPDVTPGSEDIYIKQMYFNENGYLIGVLTNGDSVQSGNRLPINLSELHDVSLTNVLAHQLIHYNDDTEKWENYTSAVPATAEGIARILNVTMDSSRQLTVKTNNLLSTSIDTAKCLIKVGSTVKTISTITTLSNTSARIVMAEPLTEAFTVQLLEDAFKVPTNNTNIYEVTSIIITLDEYSDTTQDMTLVSWSSDDGTTSFNVPTGFEWFFNTANIATIYISGNTWIGLGRSSEDVKVNRRDTYIQQYYWQLIDLGRNKILKIRWEGWSPYSSRDDAHKFIWELFLIDNGDAYLHLVSKGASASWDGQNTFNDLSYQFNDSVNKNVSFIRTGTAGTTASDWTVQYKVYKLIYD